MLIGGRLARLALSGRKEACRVRKGKYPGGTSGTHGRRTAPSPRGGLASRQADGGLQGHDCPRRPPQRKDARYNLLGERGSHARLRGGGQPHARRVGGGWWGHDSQRGEIRSRVLRGRELEALIKLFR